MKKAFLIIVTFLFLQQPIHVAGQSEAENLKKYWEYRDRLRKNFVLIGKGEGNGMCASNIDNVPANHGAELTGNPWPNTNVQYGYRRWGDGLAQHGEYLIVLATEYRLLKNEGLDVTATLNELYYAINAINRIDFFAEKYFSENSQSGVFNGFTTRDDVPKDIALRWQSQYPITNDPHDRYEGVASDTYLDQLNGAMRISNEVSQDQLIRIFYGFAHIIKLVDNLYVKPTALDMGFKLHDQVRATTDLIMAHMMKTSEFDYEINEICLGGSPVTYRVKSNWIITNPIYGEPVSRGGLAVFYSYAFTRAAQYITGKYYSPTVNMEIRQEEIGICAKGNLNFNSSVGPYWISAQNLNPQDLKFCINLPWPFQNKDICFKIPLNVTDYNVTNTLELALVGNSWTQKNINRWASSFEMYPFDLAYVLLHGGTAERSQSFYLTILNSAPCRGPYNIKDEHGHHSFDPEWNENSRWSHPFGPSKQTFGEYAGNDYMLLYNMYRLVFGKSVAMPPYGKDITCPCTASNYKLDANSLFNVISKPVVLDRKFKDYLPLKIALKEYLTHNLTITTPGRLELRTDLIVCNASTLELTAGSSLVVGEYANQSFTPCQLIIRTGSTLLIKGNATIQVLDKSSVIIEPGAKIVYEKGAKILLAGDNAVLDIQGSLHLGQDADFNFSYVNGNRGFVRFNQTNTQSSKNVILLTGTSANMTFLGYSSSDKVLELLQPVLLSKALRNFSAKACRIELGGLAKLAAHCPITIANANMTSTSGQPNNHQGLEIYGQPGVSISASTFENGGTGINALLFYGGAPLQLTNCKFLRNGAGLVTFGKGVDLQNCIFSYNQQFGWQAEGLEFNSQAKNCEFTYNTTAGLYLFSSPVRVSLVSCKVNYNEIGIITEGSSVLNVKCGEVKKNFYEGFYMMNNAVLNMSTPYGGGYVNASGNGIWSGTTMLMDNATSLLLDKGYNDMTIDLGQQAKCISSGLNCRLLIDGTINLPCNNSMITKANNNTWDNIYPWYFNNMRLNGLMSSVLCNGAQKNIVLEDKYPGSIATCGQYDHCITNPQLCQGTLLSSCIGCTTINTQNFPNTPLNTAVASALKSMDTTVVSGYKKAVNLFDEILTYPINNPKPEEVALGLWSEKKMKEAFSAAIERKQISSNDAGSNEAMKTISLLNNIIQKAGNNPEQYFRKLHSSVEKANIYRVLNKRALALNILDDIMNWVAPEQKQYVGKWRCLVNAEEMVLKGQMEKEDFAAEVSGCHANFYRKSNHRQSAEFSAPGHEVSFNISPNPSATGEFNISIAGIAPEELELRVTDALGKVIITKTVTKTETLIDLKGYPQGIYLVMVHNKDGIVQTQKLVYQAGE